MSGNLIIAMWSGPRNLSTALMRSFANRADVTKVLDEPFYGAYLRRTKKDHPMKETVINSQCSVWNEVIDICKSSDQDGITYQKHMTQHLLDNDFSWTANLCNCFLIRDPKDVVPSFLKSWPDGDYVDMGFSQQLELFNFISQNNSNNPTVVDASLLRLNPEDSLKKLCKSIKIDWDSKMLKWSSGIKEYDGVWAEHWYPSVKNSEFFKPLTIKKEYNFTDKEKRIIDQATPIYELMRSYIS